MPDLTTDPQSAFAFKRVRTKAELAQAREWLQHAGYRQCDRCSAWSDESMKARAFGDASDPRCPVCGGMPCVEE